MTNHASIKDLSTTQVEKPHENLSTVQVPSITKLSSIHWKIIDLCDVPRRLSEILQALGITGVISRSTTSIH